MDDSDDDYFSDDLVLDDKTLAVLDEEESKFRRTTNTHTRRGPGPPSKRQKTTSSWQPQPVSRTLHRADTLDDLEGLPDVSIQQDGTYGLRDKQRRPSNPPGHSGVTPGPNVVARTGTGIRPTTAVPLSGGSAPSARSASVAGPVRANQVPVRVPSTAARAGIRIALSPVSSQEVVSRTQSQRVNRVPSTGVSGNYVEQLLQQIEELRKENEAVHTNMKTTLEAKFAKEGEVTILRKRMEKTAQEHLAQLAKLKSAKDEADAKHVLMQKQYEADKERLKTELTFRRHELETSSRKPALPVSPRNDVSQRPEPLSQNQRSGQWNFAGPSRLAPETPRRPRFGVISDFEKPMKIISPGTRDLPSGFQSGPPQSQFMVGRGGKETNTSNAFNATPVIPVASPVRQESTSRLLQPVVFGTQMDDEGVIEDFVPPDTDIGDVCMADEGIPAMTLSTQEDVTILAHPSRALVLHDIMLTHTLQGSKLPTLQLLVCTSPADIGHVDSYAAVLMRIFDTLGGIPAHAEGDIDHVAEIICCALCAIAELLAKKNLISTLTAVLNLLTNLAYILPSIHTLLSSQRVPEHDETPQLLRVLHSIIHDQLQKLDVTTGNAPELSLLAKETLSLYNALVWRIPDELADTLSTCPSIPSLLTTLLHPRRPVWFLIESMRILLRLSTSRNLSRSLLSHPASEQTGNDGEPVDPAPRPQIGLACSLLTDTNRQGPEADELKSRIIMFFGMLSNGHPDAYARLVESPELIPSIVLYLCQLVAPNWDENRTVSDDHEAAARTTHINHTTLLLHHLVVGEDGTLDLRERLLRAPVTTYRGLIHRFILTLGRLSYANPPYWLDDKDRQRLTDVAELARALLERVIQGPELDLIWETYQEDGEENEAAMDVDDEEVEAQKIANA